MIADIHRNKGKSLKKKVTMFSCNIFESKILMVESDGMSSGFPPFNVICTECVLLFVTNIENCPIFTKTTNDLPKLSASEMIK